jgi:hypothetical protein
MKATRSGFGADKIDFRQLDSEVVTYKDNCFDVETYLITSHHEIK